MPDVHVLLHGDDADDATSWVRLNHSWFRPQHDRLTVLLVDTYDVQVASPANVAEAAAYAAALDCRRTQSVELAMPAIRSRSQDCALVLASCDSVARADWQQVVDRASLLAPLRAATGRWLIAPKGGVVRPELGGIHLADEMPQRVATMVQDWSFSAQMHGVSLRAIPPGFMWIAPSVAPQFLDSLAVAKRVPEAANIFFESLELERSGPCVYLPDIMVYNRTSLHL